MNTTTLSVTDVMPHRDSNGAILSLAFVAHAVDGEFIEYMSYHTPCQLPVREGEPYTDAELLAKCEQLAELTGVYQELTNRVMVRKNRPAPAGPAAPPPEMSEAEKRTAWTGQIDDHIGNILGRYTRFQLGYLEREAAARAYIAADHQGDVDEWIADFANEAKLDAPAAAALIVAQADKLRPAIKALEKLRMQKYRMRVENTATIEEAQAELLRIIGDANAIAAQIK